MSTASKRIVNSNISQLNQLIVSFPASIAASLKGLSQQPFLTEDEVENKREISSFNYDVNA